MQNERMLDRSHMKQNQHSLSLSLHLISIDLVRQSRFQTILVRLTACFIHKQHIQRTRRRRRQAEGVR